MPTKKYTPTDDGFLIPSEPLLPESAEKDVPGSKDESGILPASLRLPKPVTMLNSESKTRGGLPSHRQSEPSRQATAVLPDHPEESEPEDYNTTATTTTTHTPSDRRAFNSQKMDCSRPSALGEGDKTTQRGHVPSPEEAGARAKSGDGSEPCSSLELADGLVNLRPKLSDHAKKTSLPPTEWGHPAGGSLSSSSRSGSSRSSSSSAVQAVQRTDSSGSAERLSVERGRPAGWNCVQPVQETAEADHPSPARFPRDARSSSSSSSSSSASESSCSTPATSDSDEATDTLNLRFVSLLSSDDRADGKLEQYEGVEQETGGVVEAGREFRGVQESCLSTPPPRQAAISIEGLLFSTQQNLEDYVQNFYLKPREQGICVWEGMTLEPKEGRLVYKEGEQFIVIEVLKQNPPKHPYGVFLCCDCTSNKLFVLKRFEPQNRKLMGTEFLVKHPKPYLPEIYGVHKEKDIVNIFQEFIQGVQVIECGWDFRQVHQFAQCMLEACRFLHGKGLAHCDLKETNVVVRDPGRPDSLVIIDFESARSQNPFAFTRPGLTFTHQPPWFREILRLESFDRVLLTLDLWAIACILIPLFHRPYRGIIWSQVIEEVLQSCANCRFQGGLWCQDCRDKFFVILETQGHRILKIHLGQLLEEPIEDTHWPPLLRLVTYLTDTTNVAGKNIDSAHQIFKKEPPS